MTRAGRAALYLVLSRLCIPVAGFCQQQVVPQVTETEIAPGFHLLATPDANLVVFANEEASLVAGVHTSMLVSVARQVLTAIGAPRTIYVLIMESDSAPVYADGGWGGLGAITIAHERLIGRMRRSARVPRANALPALGFSDVVQVLFQREEAHLVHDYDGATDADVIVHFERAGVLLLGGLFTSDGYPEINLDKGGTVDGMIQWVDWFCKSFQKTGPIVSSVPKFV